MLRLPPAASILRLLPVLLVGAWMLMINAQVRETAGGGALPAEHEVTVAGGVDSVKPVVAAGLPPRPEDHIYDGSGLFSPSVYSPEKRAGLSAMLKRVEKERGMRVYLATYTYLVDEPIEDRGERLRKLWCPGEGFAVVVVFDRSTNKIHFAVPLEGEEYPIPLERMRVVLEKATRLARDEDGTAARVEATMRGIIDPLTEEVKFMKQAAANQASHDQMVLFSAVAAAVLLLTATGLLLPRLWRKKEKEAPSQLFFPSVTVQPRFGAPYGGGSCAEVGFAAPPAVK